MKVFSFLIMILCSSILQAKSEKLLHSIENSIPAVVFVANQYNSFDDYFGSDFESFECLRPFYEALWPPRQFHGSGFIISPEGHVVTSAHVVEEASSTYVALVDHEVRILKAEVLGIDSRTDIAVLKLINEDEKYSFPYLKFGDSDKTKIGEEIAVIGNPLTSALESTVTTGVLSGRSRRGCFGMKVEEFLQTDAAINPGNSGGPMINSSGEVIGIVFATVPYFEGLNFLVSSQITKKIVSQLIDYGKVVPGYLGICIVDDEEVIFDTYTFSKNQGAVIEVVQPNSPAEEAGIMVKDRVISINGRQIKSPEILLGQLAVTPADEEVTLEIIRGKEVLEFKVVLRKKA